MSITIRFSLTICLIGIGEGLTPQGNLSLISFSIVDSHQVTQKLLLIIDMLEHFLLLTKKHRKIFFRNIQNLQNILSKIEKNIVKNKVINNMLRNCS